MTQSEYPHRIERARALMQESKVDALILFAGPNLSYFTSAASMLTGRSGSRPFVYILPIDGEPILLVHAGRLFEAKTLTDVKDIRTYSRLSRVPMNELLGALDYLDLRSARIGAELSMEMVLDLPYAEFKNLLDSLPGAQISDASPLLWRLRTIKSEAEVASIAKACTITSQAYARTFSSVRPGMTEARIERMMLDAMSELGGGAPWVLITSGERNYDLVSKRGGLRQIQRGDVVWMDSGCTIDGYFSDFSRAGVLGGASDRQKDAQRIAHEITCIGLEHLRPGAAVADVARRCNAAVAALRLPITSNISGLAGRVGHGLGTMVTELPSLSEDDDTILAPGMVVTIEPGFATLYGTFHVEENVAITADGARTLSPPEWQLWDL